MTEDAGRLRVTSSRTVYENHWMRVREDETVLPDGSAGVYAVVEKPPAAVIVPLDGEDVWLVEQWRHPVGRRFWELPQGAWHDRPDAPAEDIARGELAEETGLRAGNMERIGRLYFAYGMSDQFFDVWVATDLTQGEQDLEPGEQGMIVGRHALRDVRAMVRAGTIADSGTLAALGLAGRL